MTQPGDSYFFLSHARTPPMRGETAPPTMDYWVERFFADLSAAVARHPGRDRRIGQGSHDGLLDQETDLERRLIDALSAAQVFVPLYSPRYFSSGWALAERASFLARLDRLEPADAARHVLPVLWIPVPPWQHHAEVGDALGVLDTAPGSAAVYRQHGLRELCKLAAYGEAYQSIVGMLADRIVAVPKTHPLRAPRAAELGSGTGHRVEDGQATLVVSVVAPDAGAGAGVRWHPYAGQGHTVPIADFVAATAERLGLPSRVVDVSAVAGSGGGPVVLLVDAAADGATVRAAVRDLPPWTVPLVLPAGGVPREAEGEIAGIFRSARLHEVDPAGDVRPDAEVSEVERVVPIAVMQARRQFLDHRAKDGPLRRLRPSLRPKPGAAPVTAG